MADLQQLGRINRSLVAAGCGRTGKEARSASRRLGGGAAPVMMAGGGGAAAAAPAEEKTEFTVVLKEVGANKINVIKASARSPAWV